MCGNLKYSQRIHASVWSYQPGSNLLWFELLQLNKSHPSSIPTHPPIHPHIHPSIHPPIQFDYGSVAKRLPSPSICPVSTSNISYWSFHSWSTPAWLWKAVKFAHENLRLESSLFYLWTLELFGGILGEQSDFICGGPRMGSVLTQRCHCAVRVASYYSVEGSSPETLSLWATLNLVPFSLCILRAEPETLWDDLGPPGRVWLW